MFICGPPISLNVDAFKAKCGIDPSVQEEKLLKASDSVNKQQEAEMIIEVGPVAGEQTTLETNKDLVVTDSQVRLPTASTTKSSRPKATNLLV